ncbi:glutathione S-transferase [Rhodocollybia butyracea]|uniref:glutathione transferase n=1 Tax=Rhodocollybia butyracea TaxID=206335 RepID=A0A9P5UGS0_9AGAR|nr:glutathione S-transferase [Rhodocollybia butyracea]
MVLKLVGSPYSTCTARVAVVLLEKKIPYELIPIDLSKGQQKTPEFLAKQPFGLVPYIDDDGFILYESRAICRYLAVKYRGQGTDLMPSCSDLKATALFEQAVATEATSFDPFASGAGFEVNEGLTTDQSSVDAAVAKLTVKLNGYELILGKQKYLAGDDLTLADLFHLPWGATLAKFDCKLLTTTGPNVTR